MTSHILPMPRLPAWPGNLLPPYYGKPAAYSYFVGCSTGGREGMVLSQRYPMAFNGIISGDPAMRTGFSNLAIARWVPVASIRLLRRMQTENR